MQIKTVSPEGKESFHGVDAQHLMVLNSGSDLPVSVPKYQLSTSVCIS